jgi:putative spermidine/putrescine transport system substrate-binding protein
MQSGHHPWRATPRPLVAAVAVALAASALAACGSSSPSPSKYTAASSTPKSAAKTLPNGMPNLHGVTISYLGFGGATDQMMDKAWFEPFERLTGAKITLDSPTDYKKLQIQEQSGNVTYDLVDGDAFVMDPGCGKSWTPVSLPNLKYVLPAYKPKSACTAPDYIYSYVIMYSPKAFPNGGPTDCQDFYNTKKFPGKRQVWSYYYGNSPECAAIANGADPHDPYSMSVSAISNKLASIKGSLQTYDTPNQAIDAMQNNDVAMGIYTTRMAYVANLNQHAGWKWASGWAANANGTFGIPKGAPHAAAAEALLNYILAPQNSKRFYEDFPAYGSPEGAKIAAAAHLPQYLVSGSPTLTKVGFVVNQPWWSKNDPVFSQDWVNDTSG